MATSRKSVPSKPKSVLTAAGTCAAAGLVADGLVCTIDGLVGDGTSREAQAALQTGTVNDTATGAHTVLVTFGGFPDNGEEILLWKSGADFIFSWGNGSALGRTTGGATLNLVGVTTGSIDGAGSYGNFGKVHAGVANQYVGISFPNAGPGQRYGWIELGNYVAGTAIQVLNWGFEDSGAPAPLEEVPEPGTLGLGLLALGAAGVSAYKRRRSSAKQGTAGE